MFLRRALLVCCIVLPLLASCGREPAQETAAAFNTPDITGADFARHLELPDADGKPRTLADWKGRVTVVFFGYTQCPDVCPTTLAELMQIRRSLGAEGEKLQTVFVTVDPERDTPVVLRAYIGNFGPGITALRGSAQQTEAAAKEFKVFYAKEAGPTPDTYTMSHTAAAFVFDPQGRARLYVPFGTGADLFAADLRRLIEGA